MNRSPFAATIVVLFFLVGVPIALVQRLADGLLPTQAYDIALLVGVGAWIFIAKAILDRSTPLTMLVENRMSPSWQAHSLVEQSLLGVGFTGLTKATVVNHPRLYQLHSPHTPIEALMPPQVHAPTPGRARSELSEEGRPRSQPTLRTNEPAVPPILATEEYTIARGDTFWSIAEQRLHSGKRWKQIEEINIGREVAPDVFFTEGDAIRIGWTVLVPLAEEAESNS